MRGRRGSLGVAVCMTTWTSPAPTRSRRVPQGTQLHRQLGQPTELPGAKGGRNLPSLSVSPSSGATVDSPVTLTVNLAANGTLSPPTGTVAFTVNGATPSGCGSVPLVSLSATCAVGPLPAGDYTLEASYSGDASITCPRRSPSRTTRSARAHATVALAASPSSGADITSPASLTATVSGAGGPAPTGTVDFTWTDGSTVAGCGSVSVTSGTATCSAGTLPAGSHALEASYSGDTKLPHRFGHHRRLSGREGIPGTVAVTDAGVRHRHRVDDCNAVRDRDPSRRAGPIRREPSRSSWTGRRPPGVRA